MTDAQNLDEIVSLRNTISGVAMQVTRREANRILEHPVFGPVNEIVRSAKPEVLTERGEKAVSAYSLKNKPDLIADAETRNHDLGDDEKIDLTLNKEDLIAALEADDAKHAEDAD